MSTDGAGGTVENYSAGENALLQYCVVCTADGSLVMALVDIYNQRLTRPRGNETQFSVLYSSQV